MLPCRIPNKAWSPIAAFVLLALSVVIWLQRPARSRISPPQCPLFVDSTSLNFGEVLESSDFRWEVPLRNTSSRRLKIYIERSCDCSGIEPEKFALAPGESRQVKVKLDLLHNRDNYTDSRSRPFVTHFTAVYGDRASERHQLELAGTVRAVLAVWPPNCHFDEDVMEGVPSAETTARLTPNVPLAWLVVKDAPASLSAHIEKDKGGYLLRVRILGKEPHGRISTRVVLQMADAAGKSLPDRSIPVTGNVTNRIIAFPSESTIGVRAVGSTVDEYVQLSSRDRTPFKVVKVACDEYTTCVEDCLRNEFSTMYRITQRVGQLGDGRGKVLFHVRDASGRSYEVVFRTAYYGVKAHERAASR